ncbi:hypothetical protein HDU97_004234 [Phlyctochytrium planicorne]|nr:hypothetical protein HDU97_004234 [Phlyctochytrium planicorne]
MGTERTERHLFDLKIEGQKDSKRFRYSLKPPSSPIAEKLDEQKFINAANGAAGDANFGLLHGERPTDHPHVFHNVPITKLYIFDFDSTLFRSPLPNPQLWAPEVLGTLISDCGWFVEPRTLRHPYIPASPDPSWWDLDVVAEVRKAMKSATEDGDSVVTLLTGRRHDLFADRIRELCHAFDSNDPLKFDLFFFREGFDPNSRLFLPTTLDFKFAVLKRLFDAFPEIQTVHLWDDRKRHLDLFEREFVSLKNLGRIQDYKLIHVVHDPMMEKHISPDQERKLVQEMVERCNARIVAAREREEARLGGGLATPPPDPDILNAPATPARRRNSGRSGNLNPLLRPNSLPSLTSVSEAAGMCSEPEGIEVGPSACSLADQETFASVPNLSNGIGSKPPSAPNKSEKSNLGRLRRSSASLFRSLIELTDIVYFTGIFLDAESKETLLSKLKPPQRWSIRADHVTICMGLAGGELIKPLGGQGGTVKLRVVARGELPGKVLAARVELAEIPEPFKPSNDEDGENDNTSAATVMNNPSPMPRLSVNAVPHITIAVAVGAHGRESNDVKEWVELQEPFVLSGIVSEKKLVGLKGRSQPGNSKPKEVSLGALVMKHHPSLKGKEIGRAVTSVEKWMAKTFMDNLAQNSAAIEMFISNLKVSNGKVEDD